MNRTSLRSVWRLRPIRHTAWPTARQDIPPAAVPNSSRVNPPHRSCHPRILSTGCTRVTRHFVTWRDCDVTPTASQSGSEMVRPRAPAGSLDCLIRHLLSSESSDGSETEPLIRVRWLKPISPSAAQEGFTSGVVSAADNTIGSGRRTGRVRLRCIRVRIPVRRQPVPAPLDDVACHVIQAEAVCHVRTGR